MTELKEFLLLCADIFGIVRSEEPSRYYTSAIPNIIFAVSMVTMSAQEE